MNSAKIALAAVLECGYMDIDFITNLEDKFTEFDWSTIISENLYANGVISTILYNCMYEVCDECGVDANDVEYDIYCNCLDSHLYVHDGEGWIEWKPVHRRYSTASRMPE